MSQLENQLKVLFKLSSLANTGEYVSLSKIKEVFDDDISDRQIRRYLENLSTETTFFTIYTKKGANGGYKLDKPLGNSYTLSQDIILALTLASKGNQKIETLLSSVVNYVTHDYIDESNKIEEIMMDSLKDVLTACIESRKLSFLYADKTFIVKPYRIKYANHSAYLMCLDLDDLKYFDVSKMRNIVIKERFRQISIISKSLKDIAQEYYGVWSKGTPAVVKFKYLSEEGRLRFLKVFEGKGIFDDKNHTFEIKAYDKHIIFLKLLEIPTSEYQFILENDKKEYIYHLKKVIKAIENK